jgi:hypothetical protein
MQQNPNGMLVDRDEMLALFDRLDQEGHADERGFYLSGWNRNSPYTVDRIGRGLDLHVEAVCISTIGGTQPARLSQYLAQTRRGGRNNDGLIQRFGLLVWPDVSPTWENVDRKPDKYAAAKALKVFERLDGMDWRAVGAKRDIGFGGEEEGLPYLKLSERTHSILAGWRTQLELRLRSGENDPMMESHLAKYRKLVPALALIIHLADAEDGAVGEVGPSAWSRRSSGRPTWRRTPSAPTRRAISRPPPRLRPSSARSAAARHGGHCQNCQKPPFLQFWQWGPLRAFPSHRPSRSLAPRHNARGWRHCLNCQKYMQRACTAYPRTTNRKGKQMTDTKDETTRFDRMAVRAEILIPAVHRMLADGHSFEEMGATLRTHADLVEGKVDPAEEAGNRTLAEEVAKAFAEEGVPFKYHHH